MLLATWPHRQQPECKKRCNKCMYNCLSHSFILNSTIAQAFLHPSEKVTSIYIGVNMHKEDHFASLAGKKKTINIIRYFQRKMGKMF